MGLGLPVKAAGEFMSLVKYDARAGRMFRVDRVERNGAWEKQDVEVTQGFTAIFDLKNIDVGYVRFAEGGAPEWAMVKIGQPLPAKPSQDFRQGFRVNIKLAKSIGGDVREFSSAAGCVISAMDQLYDAYSKAPEAAAGKLPVVTMTGSTPVKSGSGAKTSTNYAPHLTITSWVDRPAELNGSATSAPAPMSTPSVAPPVAQPQPVQTPSVATEF